MEKSMFRLDGKTVLVTGAATGIGAGIAVTLARQGATVVISDKPGVSLTATAESVKHHNESVMELEMDVCDAGQIQAGIQKVREAFGKIDILVNNAAVNRPAPGLEVTEESWDAHFEANVKGGFFLAQQVVPLMIQQKWGRVIWISSQSGLIGIPGQPVYCSTKGAVIQLVRVLGLEWAKYGITVNSVAPTFIETNMTRKRLQNQEFLRFVLGKIPIGRLATIDEVAAAVAFLASDEASMVNCHALRVDGGWTAW